MQSAMIYATCAEAVVKRRGPFSVFLTNSLPVSVAQRLGRRTSYLAVMGSIPGPGVITHLSQLSLPSLRDR